MNEIPPPPSGGDQPASQPIPSWHEGFEAYEPAPPPPPPGSEGAPATEAAPAAVRVRRRRRVGPVLTVAAVAGTVAASALVSHEIWPSSPGVRAALGAAQTGPSSSSGSSNSGASGGQSAPSGFGDSGLGGDGSSGSGSSDSGSNSGSGSATSSNDGPTDVSSIAAKIDPALVDINVSFKYQGAQGAGTGIVLTSDGEILTNNHVINGATSISVTDIGNGKTYTANVVGYDATDDVAVLQLVGASGLKTASVANSDNVKVGQQVVAVGNAGGTGGTPSASGGTVTALGQSITASDELNGSSEQLTDLIETDADVQSGDSGGSLVNTSGQVVGMDAAAAQGYSLQTSGGSANQGYAIPINKALSIAKAIEAGKSSSTVHVGSTAFLGVLLSSGSSGSSSSGSSFGGFFGGSGASGASGGDTSGAVISGVVSGGPAATAGLGQGDTITGIDGHDVASASDISSLIAGDHPGQTLQITWTDQDGTSHTTAVTLQAGPPA